MSFGQSFQITPVIMLRAAAAIVNGGKLVTPHFAVKAAGADGETVQEFCYETVTDAITEETSNTMKDILRQVVEDGNLPETAAWFGKIHRFLCRFFKC